MATKILLFVANYCFVSAQCSSPHLPYIEMLSQVDIILQRTDFLPLVLILHLQVCISILSYSI
jgi:hypothetical protein